MYEIEFSKKADKQFSKLDKAVQERVSKTLERIRIRPYPHVKKLVASQYYRLRVGPYRVILDIVDTKLIILVVKVGHRKNFREESSQD